MLGVIREREERREREVFFRSASQCWGSSVSDRCFILAGHFRPFRWPYSPEKVTGTFSVAEESLVAPEKPDLRTFDHPYVSFLFFGVDSAGDFIPVKQLREKYNQPRYEVPFDPEDDEEDGGDAS